MATTLERALKQITRTLEMALKQTTREESHKVFFDHAEPMITRIVKAEIQKAFEERAEKKFWDKHPEFARPTRPRSGALWTVKEEKDLMHYFQAFCARHATAHNRTPEAIRARIKKVLSLAVYL